MRFGAADSAADDAGGKADDEEKDAAEAGERNVACAIDSAGGGCAADAPETAMIGENELRFDAPACRPSPAGRPTGIDCATRPDWNC